MAMLMISTPLSGQAPLVLADARICDSRTGVLGSVNLNLPSVNPPPSPNLEV